MKRQFLIAVFVFGSFFASTAALADAATEGHEALRFALDGLPGEVLVSVRDTSTTAEPPLPPVIVDPIPHPPGLRYSSDHPRLFQPDPAPIMPRAASIGWRKLSPPTGTWPLPTGLPMVFLRPKPWPPISAPGWPAYGGRTKSRTRDGATAPISPT